LIYSPAGYLLVTSGFCNPGLADSALGIIGLARKTRYLGKILGSTVSIALDAPDTKLAVGRELTESNLLSALGEQKIRRLFLLTSDGGRISADPESGGSF